MGQGKSLQFLKSKKTQTTLVGELPLVLTLHSVSMLPDVLAVAFGFVVLSARSNYCASEVLHASCTHSRQQKSKERPDRFDIWTDWI